MTPICGIYVHETAIRESGRPPPGQQGYICGREKGHEDGHAPGKEAGKEQ